MKKSGFSKEQEEAERILIAGSSERERETENIRRLVKDSKKKREGRDRKSELPPPFSTFHSRETCGNNMRGDEDEEDDDAEDPQKTGCQFK